MNDNSDLLPNLLHDEFELQMRGYSRRQVDDFVARRNGEFRELEQRLDRALEESEQLRRELSAVRQQALSGRPAHEEVSERISQILKLADDEAKAQKNKADDDISRQRSDAQQEAERVRTDAREQAERMLTAAQEQAERTIAAARNEAEKTRNDARGDADRLTNETRQKSDTALAQSKAQAKRVLDEATARATAIHDGAERRLSLLSTRHAETVRRLGDILDGVQGLVSAESARMSLEEEVDQTASRTLSESAAAEDGPDDGAPAESYADAQPDEHELSRLAPPAPETVTSGPALPPPADEEGHPQLPGRPGLTSRIANPAAPQAPVDPRLASDPFSDPFGAPDHYSAPDPYSAPGPLGGPGPDSDLLARRARTGGGRHEQTDGQSPLGPGTGRLRGLPEPEDDPRPGRPGGGAPGVGHGDPLADRDGGGPGLIDPDEPTEGVRLLR